MNPPPNWLRIREASWASRLWLVAGVTVTVILVIAFQAPIPQPQSYHDFADQRAFFGIPNCLDVLSNLPFLLIGLWGAVFALRRAQMAIRPPTGRMTARGVGPHATPGDTFITAAERWPYLVLFLGVLLTCLGSAYYHLAPDNTRLVWDRLPMTLGFMSLLAAVVAERINLKLGLRSLLALGLASVVQWHLSEQRGEGDLRFYLMVQFFPLLAIPLLLVLLPPRYTRGSDLMIALGIYGLAKVFELLDREMFALGGVVSGHTLKHLTAAIAIWWLLRMLMKRVPSTD